MRERTAAVLLTISVLAWGLWCGGQYFNEARVIPRMLSDPPDSLIAYNRIPAAEGGLPFFFPLNPLIFLLPLAAALAAWKTARRARKWLVLTAAIGLGVCLVLILYLAPLIAGIAADAGSVSPAEIAARAGRWKLGNRIRLFVEFAGFVGSTVALNVWSAESNKNETGFS